MTTDLDYFHEADLNYGNLDDFYESLPYNLKPKFRKCLHAGLVPGNALQGYRGPSHMCSGGSGDSETLEPSNGLQEIKFWWGAKKTLIFTPVIGAIVFVVGRLLQKLLGVLDWSSLYFDSKTGNCLGHKKNKACMELCWKGDELVGKRQFVEAAEYYRNAYRSCSDWIVNKKSFQDNESRLYNVLNKNGDELFREGQYVKAAQYFRNAYACCSDWYKEEASSYSLKRMCDELNEMGDQLLKDGRLVEAAENYGCAYEYCSYNHPNEQTFRENLSRACNELNGTGDQLFEEGRFAEAAENYGYANELYSNYHPNKLTFLENLDRAKSEEDAINANARGDNLFEQGEYSQAFEEYQNAYEKSQVESQRSQYRTNMNKVEATNLNSEGDHFYRQGEYDKAYNKYREAYDKSNEEWQYRLNTQAIVDKLSSLETAWNRAWEAENDANGGKEEVRSLFQIVLNKFEEGSRAFSDVSKTNQCFKLYAALAALKIEATDLFNLGLESKQRGIKLLQAAQELNLRRYHELANRKFEEAKGNFEEALANYKAVNYKRFVSCATFVQKEIDEVNQLIDLSDQQPVSLGLESLELNLDCDIGSNFGSGEPDSRLEPKYYELM